MLCGVSWYVAEEIFMFFFLQRLVDWETPLSCHPRCHDVLWPRAPVQPSSYGWILLGQCMTLGMVACPHPAASPVSSNSRSAFLSKCLSSYLSNQS
jgi:hypothetical protein